MIQGETPRSSVGLSALGPRRGAKVLERELSRALGTAVELTVVSNRRRLLSSKPGPWSLKVRAHPLFLAAPKGIIGCMVEVLRSGCSESSARLRRFVSGHFKSVGGARSVYRTQGENYDLVSLFRRTNAQYFDGRIESKITWGRRAAKGRHRSIRLGSYTEDEDLIRIHPALDQDFVPEFFIAFIVFHEMLHALVPPEISPSGRCNYHPPRFRRFERAHPDYQRVLRWEKEHLYRLLQH